MDDRRCVALIHDPVERNVTEPTRRLGRSADQPFPIVISIPIDLAVRLADLAVRHDGVMQTTPMRPVSRPIDLDQLLGEPLTVAMSGFGVDPVGIDRHRQDRQV
jgi:hypothetical protein